MQCRERRHGHEKRAPFSEFIVVISSRTFLEPWKLVMVLRARLDYFKQLHCLEQSVGSVSARNEQHCEHLLFQWDDSD